MRLVLWLSLFCVVTQAVDVIYLKSGKVLQGVILEETKTTVRFFSTDNKKVRLEKKLVKHIERRQQIVGVEKPKGLLYVGQSTAETSRSSKWSALQDASLTVFTLTYVASILATSITLPSATSGGGTLKALVPVAGPLLASRDSDNNNFKSAMISATAVQAVSLLAFAFGAYKQSTVAVYVSPLRPLSLVASLDWSF